jgi:predicted permease
MTGGVSSTSIFIHGRTYTPKELQGEGNDINRLIISPAFFGVMGLPVLTGRALTDHDDRAAPTVAVINETAVRTYFRGVNPLGQRFGTNPNRPSDIEIVGVVRDAKYADLREAAPPTMYVSYLQAPRATTTFELRTEAAPAAGAVRDVVHQLDPNLPIVKISTQADEIERRLAMERLFAQAYAIFGGVALLLASVGLFGLMSYNVARRTAEMGIRMALGAQRIDVLRMVMRESLLLVAAGVVAGLAIAFGAGRLLATLLFGLAPHDLSTLMAAIAVMVVVSAVAAYLPARRASRVDPIVALRYE